MAEFRIETERLILREWREDDLGDWAGICADPIVMETIGPLRTRDEAWQTIVQQQKLQAETGMCFWAIERRSDRRMIGFCGLEQGDEYLPIERKVEIGWRLASDCWGRGHAREAAEASMEWGWNNVTDDSIWAITASINSRSCGLMERLGMARHRDLDFDHPGVPDGSPLKRHITYSIARPGH